MQFFVSLVMLISSTCQSFLLIVEHISLNTLNVFPDLYIKYSKAKYVKHFGVTEAKSYPQRYIM